MRTNAFLIQLAEIKGVVVFFYLAFVLLVVADVSATRGDHMRLCVIFKQMVDGDVDPTSERSMQS